MICVEGMTRAYLRAAEGEVFITENRVELGVGDVWLQVANVKTVIITQTYISTVSAKVETECVSGARYLSEKATTPTNGATIVAVQRINRVFFGRKIDKTET